MPFSFRYYPLCSGSVKSEISAEFWTSGGGHLWWKCIEILRIRTIEDDEKNIAQDGG